MAQSQRPGDAHPYGAKSEQGFSLGETYTLKVVNDIAGAIQSIKSRWKAPAVILVGDFGGAAVAADVAAFSPGLVQHVFLIACPCNVPALRWYMARPQWNPMWLVPARSLSPMQTLERMEKKTKLTVISGMGDSIAVPKDARSYTAKANALGISASLIMIPARGHAILNDPAVIGSIAKAVRENSN